MATQTSRSRTWNFPTSPRSPYKLQGELTLLKEFDGDIWNIETQEKFAAALAGYGGFEGDVSETETGFSARDRLRGPRLLGFICTPKRGERNGRLRFTEMGNIFLSATEQQQELIFQRQIAKVQYHSYLHNSKGFEDMNVRPMMLMIKMLLELDKMSKTEIGLFALTTIDHSKIDAAIQKVRDYRKEISLRTPGSARKQFRVDFAEQHVAEIYADEIANGRTKLREGGNNFIATKLRTLKDYADSTIRYLRSTGLFTVLPHGQSLTLTKARLDDAEYLLSNYGTAVTDHEYADYYDYVNNYLGNPSLPTLRIDNTADQLNDFNRKIVKVEDAGFAKALKDEFALATSSTAKINTIIKLDQKITELQLKNEAKTIRSDFSSSLLSIGEMYAKINTRGSEIVDRPLMYEWNTWRSMVLINDALNVQGNYHADADGNPVSTASGNTPDILCEYDTFWLGVEVTLQGGMKQYEAEGESITRHIGNLQKNRLAANDKRSVFGLFIAERINPEVISHLFTVAKIKSQVYKGPVKILPIDREAFSLMTKSIMHHENFNHRVLHQFFDDAFTLAQGDIGEIDWFEAIKTRAGAIHLNDQVRH